MKKLLNQLAKLTFGDYSAFHIYSHSIDTDQEPSLASTGLRFVTVEKAQVESSKDDLIIEQAWYHGSDTHAYACLVGCRIVGLCYFWHGERYRKRNFWPLSDGEAKLVQVVTVPDMRGHGIATGLISYASNDMGKRGFHRLYARIWHSNTSSSRAFKRAGWRRVATVIEVHLLRRKTPLRITFRVST